MSDQVLALLITFAIIALLLLWVPFLNLICPPCGRFLERRRLSKKKPTGSKPSFVIPIRHKTAD